MSKEIEEVAQNCVFKPGTPWIRNGIDIIPLIEEAIQSQVNKARKPLITQRDNLLWWADQHWREAHKTHLYNRMHDVEYEK